MSSENFKPLETEDVRRPTGMNECKRCHAPIRWIKMGETKKNIPLDPEPTEDHSGNIILDAAGYGYMVNPREVVEEVPTYKSHFATCPFAKEFRKPR